MLITVPDEKWAERPLAAVVPIEDGEDLTDEERQAILAERVAKLYSRRGRCYSTKREPTNKGATGG